MGKYRMGPPETLVTALQKHLQLGCFVETGTYRGNTAAWASEHFPQVITIELSPIYYASAKERFDRHHNVRALGGDSKQVLTKVLADLSVPALFWLDAHWSGLDTAGREHECPLLGEIRVINDAPAPHVVLVDDARLFAAPPPRPHRAEEWPDLFTVVDALDAGGRRYVALYEDVLIGVPVTSAGFLKAFLQEAVTVAHNRPQRGLWWKKIWR